MYGEGTLKSGCNKIVVHLEFVNCVSIDLRSIIYENDSRLISSTNDASMMEILRDKCKSKKTRKL